MDEALTMSDKGKVPTPQTGRAELINAIAELHAQFNDTEGIAISMPGIIDAKNGYCVMGGALRYNDDFYLRHALYEKCPVKITVENDAKCAALADVSDGFVLTFGTMIGGGISAQPSFIEAIRRSLKELYSVCPYYVPHAEIVT